jgi:N-acyl-D-aspartate/D-glutamate deacylase
MVEASGRPLSISIAQADRRPQQWREMLAKIDEAVLDGLAVRGQVAARAIGVLHGLQATWNPFMFCESFKTIASKPLAEKVAALRDPSLREALVREADEGKMPVRLDRLFALGDPPDYEPDPATSIAAQAERMGVKAPELILDLLTEDEGRALLYMPFLNYADGDLEPVREMLLHDHTVAGLSDGGAHVGTICDASFPTTLLTHWGRDRRRGDRIDLPWLVRRQTRDTAETVGLRDRGVLAPGKKADVNVIDFEGLRLRPPAMAFDLPAGGKRLLQKADGYLHTFVSGTEVYASGEHTGALPGRLVRGERE